MIRAAALSALIAATINLSIVSSAAFADERTCILDPVSGLLECTLIAAPGPPVKIRLSMDLPFEWLRLPFNVGDSIARGHGCVRTVGGVAEIGFGYVIVLNNVATGEQLYLKYVCTWPGDPPPEPPPAPPSAAEFAEANARALTLRPVLSPASSIGGLTGLESWLWCVDPGPVGTSVTLRGWTATGTVHVVQVTWTVDGSDGIVDISTSCGSEQAPSVTWTPQVAGEHSVLLTTVWAGTWDLTWDGLAMGAFPLGPISLTSPVQPYPIDEYRGELTE